MAATHLDRLVEHLADGDVDTALAHDLRRWMEASRRFRAFAETHRDKIRKKVRVARGEDAHRGLRAELAAAHALLADRRVDLAYERAGSSVGGPDFTVSFRSHLAFNLEVTSSRGDPGALERQLLAKLHQLPPGVPNALLVAVDRTADDLPDVDRVVRAIRARPDDRETRLRLGRLGGVYAWLEAEDGRGAWPHRVYELYWPRASASSFAPVDAAEPSIARESAA